LTAVPRQSVADARSPWRFRTFWFPSGYVVAFVGAVVSDVDKLALLIVAALSVVMAIVKTRGRGAGSGLSLGFLAGIASIGVTWYFDTHSLTLASAVVLASLVLAAAIIAGALIVRRAT
jgi:hypothetical protein